MAANVQDMIDDLTDRLLVGNETEEVKEQIDKFIEDISEAVTAQINRALNN